MKPATVVVAAACLTLPEISAFHVPLLSKLGPHADSGTRLEVRNRPQQRRVQHRVGPAKAIIDGAVTSSTSTPVSVDAADVDGERQVLGVETEPADETELPYDWRKHWYAVGYDRDIVAGPKPVAASIFDEPLVLFRDNSGALQCVSDFCPHRASKLSEGQVTDEGNLECLYHGWQFEGAGGSCLKIPQMAKGGIPPRAARLRVYPVAVSEGVVYVWMGNDPWGEEGAKEILPVPCSADRMDENKPSFTYEFAYDLPYDWSYLAENLLDPAHIPVSHDKTEGGGKKENAGPIEFNVIRDGDGAPGPTGFSALVVSQGLGATGKKFFSDYTWEAPGVIRVRSRPDKETSPRFGASLHCIPLGKGRSRLLFKTYGVNFPAGLMILFKLKPKVLRHLNSCKILEQDMGLICAQEDYVARTGETLSDAFLPIKTSDGLVVEYRKWLDRVGHGMPFFQGWKKSKQPADLSNHEDVRRYNHRAQESRYNRHVLITACTRRVLAKVKLTKKVGFAAAAVLAAASLLLLSSSGAAAAAAAAGTASSGGGAAALASRVGGTKASVVAAVGAVCSLGLGAAAGKFEGHFYRNFDRHPALV